MKYMSKLCSILIFLKAKCWSVFRNSILQLQRQQCISASGREGGRLFINTEETVYTERKKKLGKMKGRKNERQMVNVFKELYHYLWYSFF